MTERKDDINKYYLPVEQLELILSSLFWIIAAITLSLLYINKLPAFAKEEILHIFLIILIALHFVFSQVQRFYLIPRAEDFRRKQFISDSLGTHLTHDKTVLYYNNNFPPSINRLGANTMENSFFSKEIASAMLFSKRLITLFYIIVWLFAISSRDTNFDLLTWITQILFSGEIITQWIKLEISRFKYENIYNQLHKHFLHKTGDTTPESIASILDIFVTYESEKLAAGIKLSSKFFYKLNPSLTKKWEKIRTELKMN
jgi:hypothetical protein